MFRIPGLIIFVVCALAEIGLRLAGKPSEISFMENVNLPTFMVFSGVGLLMFIAPYILMAWDIYANWKNSKSPQHTTKKQFIEEDNGQNS